MHGAHFDLGSSAGKGLRSPGKTSLAAAPSASGCGAVVMGPGCQCLKTPNPGVVTGFRGSRVLPLCPLPLPVHVCILFLSQCFPCKNYPRNPLVSWPGPFCPTEQDMCCRWPGNSRICSPFPCCIPHSGMLLALSPGNVRETSGFPAVLATVLHWGEQGEVVCGR